MLFIFVTCFSFILFFRYSLPIKPLPSWASEMRLLSFYFWKDLSILFPSSKILKKTLFSSYMFSPKTAKKINTLSRNTESMMIEGKEQEKVAEMSVLDLPNLALECILERLEPDGLCKMACVSTYLKDMCLSDHLWEGHMKKRWGRIIGSAAYKEWQLHIASRNESNYFLGGEKGKSILMGYLSKLWPLMLLGSNSTNHGDCKKMKSCSPQPPVDSIVACYRALETGQFWFPAQVFNREVVIFLVFSF